MRGDSKLIKGPAYYRKKKESILLLGFGELSKWYKDVCNEEAEYNRKKKEQARENAKKYRKKADAKRLKHRAKHMGDCLNCGNSDTRVIQLHHINRGNTDAVMPLCCNCHRLFHVIMGANKRAESRSREEVLNVLRQDRAR